MLNPERVELVRLRLGLTKIGFAKSLGVDRKTLQRFEAAPHEHELSDEYVENLVRLSRYPRAYFEKTGSPELPSADAVSFRSLRSLTAGPRNRALAAGALAFELDDWIASRYDLPPHSIPKLDDRDPRDAALALRARWGIGERPIGNMINMLESHGVRVFSLSEETRHLDAYSFWRNGRPYVFLNTMKTAEHSRMDAAHELAHLTLHAHGGPSSHSAEHEANTFASAFLMPPGDLRANMPFVRRLSDLVRGKKRWGVSAATLAYALHKQGVISDWHYRGYCIELNKAGREKEPEPMQPETSQVWQKILTDLWRQGISMSRISQELCIPEHELTNLLFGIARTPTATLPRGRPALSLV
jgi:Zn-dependent peptidase ImmA (M78 family)/DNA-binding XRE family transcriptional regulator